MALITWNDTLSVNVEEIDQQHRTLIAMINELNEAMKLGKGKDVLGKIVNSLISYTAIHFKTEETYFAQFGYPDTENHKKEHAAFVQKVVAFKGGFEKKELSLTINVMGFLSDWLKDHIMGTDKKYTGFFNEMGLK
ncbi:MAG: hemerythrin family protein [Desulfobacterium sp.]|nr:hemerythrin family protein [Desulfobacterium sp.]